ncbi:ErpM protein (plasmid) [Borreliella burgdorferi 29805]|uniref:ErpM protein n=4 Tax=Borreliella burgdorferi TaxID=139 RepID=UPI00017F42B1|nr:ErpM protein [Borreliella burgdorferi]ACO38504.1 ErpM protein [Borreliella burgdorferi 29805]ATH10585.1 ErpC protein [Borreliella burgdorferi]MCD2309472.1 ErpC protein [Borreliella burgdorferi]MCD2318726.1 ErpC protein [Borreliella burgdorferi]MCD2319738.1 ErpC protein [Borreliella burgdorferi]
MNKKILIIFAVFALIISCKNYATGKDIKQNAKGKIKGFLDKVLDPAKDKITSSSSKVDELAKKLQEEDKDNELMQGDDPNNRAIALLPVLPENSHDNPPVPKVKAAAQSGGQQEDQKAKESKDKVEEEKEVVEEKKEEQDSKKEKVEKQSQKQKEEERNSKEEQQKQEEAKARADREREERLKQQEQKRQQEEARVKAEKEKQEREEQQKQEEEKKVKYKIKTLTDKIDEINKDIDGINGKTIVGAEEVIDKITGPVYDDFTDGNKAIYKTWGDLEDEEGEELGKLLKELSDTRHNLRTKLNEGNKAYIVLEKEPNLKENVNVGEIKSDLEKLKSKLEDVKKYLEDNSKFEEIKGYITDNSDYYDED